jgi:hypothetical protein
MTYAKPLTKKEVKKVKTQDFMGKTIFFLITLPFSHMSNFIHMAACRSSSKNTRKMNVKPILNKTSPRAHTELEFDVLGVPRKLVKYVVHLLKKKWK